MTEQVDAIGKHEKMTEQVNAIGKHEKMTEQVDAIGKYEKMTERVNAIGKYEKMTERVNAIWKHEKYQECMMMIGACEEGRIYCGHDMAHFLDVARLAYILNLEEEYGVSKELIYAAALLHDIGRHLQYMEEIPHEQAGTAIANVILQDCGFEEKEKNAVLEAVINHRNEAAEEVRNLAGLIYRADKMSRCCFACEAQKSCHKPEEKRRMEL